MENENPTKNDRGGSERPRKSFNFYWIYGVIIVVILSIQLMQLSGGTRPIEINEYERYLNSGDVRRIDIVNDETVLVTIKKDSLAKKVHTDKLGKEAAGNSAGPHYRFTIGNSDAAQNKLVASADAHGVEMNYETQDNWGRDIIQWVLFIGIMLAVWMFFMRRLGGGGGPGGQIFNIGKSRAQVFEAGKSTNITFNDVAGLDEAKEELQEIVDFLKTPKKYTALGAKIPKGALLVGPPGTGKTLLAKAIAGEANVPFFSLSGSDFVEMFVGVGASRVRDLFKQAKEKAPAIIFIDEIDAIGRARGRSVSMGANDERENTLNQLLTEMDGFGTNSGVILIGATNRADVLDRALMRPGRFDRQIFVDMPDLNGRIDIFKVHLKPLKLDTALDVEFLARQTPGFSGADIANICNEAALIAARKKKTHVEKQDFLDAVDRVIGGLEKKNKIITADEKRGVAYHEAGHATVSWLVEHASPLIKVTIVPRGRSLGAAWYLPEERHLTTAEQMLDEICAALGGRAAEDVMFGKVSTGALSDLEKVTKQAYAMVSVYGLNAKVGNISFYDSTGQSEYSFGKPYSERTAQTIDEEVSKLVEIQYERAKKILVENKDKLTALASQLLEKEVIFKEDLEKIFGDRTFARDVAERTAAANSNGTTVGGPAPTPDETPSLPASA
ncbi:MAG: ATP-dependent zinc metalloprotease FtsH [Flavobacteriales bacterium]|nr:ATP-dependent zinc metalloprotease FtsH [Flavobacteriales bacterium]MBK9286397.1 ATP-dependent zinc metalloprotease FtsH [Flavobacteriales bacterium]MBL0034768.1 ATP-dependent zinc metalloprotease FtsH [Flavobacteriales bacterium]